jgi:hypothetical protein
LARHAELESSSSGISASGGDDIICTGGGCGEDEACVGSRSGVGVECDQFTGGVVQAQVGISKRSCCAAGAFEVENKGVAARQRHLISVAVACRQHAIGALANRDAVACLLAPEERVAGAEAFSDALRHPVHQGTLSSELRVPQVVEAKQVADRIKSAIFKIGALV